MSSAETPPADPQLPARADEPTASTAAPTTDAFGVKPPAPTVTGADRFDYLAQVVRPNLLIALIAIVAVIAGATVWAVFATITSSTTVTMVLGPEQGFVNVAAPAAGTITEFTAQNGMKVAAGQKVATITTASGKQVAVRVRGAGTVAHISADLGTIVESLSPILLLSPAGEPRSISGFPPEGAVADVTVGQSAVVSAYGCAALPTTVKSIEPFPYTRDGAVAMLGSPGLTLETMPEATGIGIQLVVPTTWCPTAPLGTLVSVVITTGSTHPISYVTP